MLRMSVSEEELAQVRHGRYHHPHPRVRRKLEAVLLKAEGLPHHRIAVIVGVSENTLRSYLEAYAERGIQGLTEVQFYRPASELEAHAETLGAYFREHPFATLAEACAAIERLTGLRRSQTQVSAFLRRLGLRRRRVYPVPAKVDPARQEAFLQ
jgi:transposase